MKISRNVVNWPKEIIRF